MFDAVRSLQSIARMSGHGTTHADSSRPTQGYGPNNAALSRTCCIMPYTLQILAQSGGGRSMHSDGKKAAPIFTSAFTELRAILQSGAYSFILAFRPA